MKRIYLLAFPAFLISCAIAFSPAKAGAFTQTRLMDDGVFDNVATMNQGQIQAMLDGTDGKLASGSTCLKNYQTPNFAWDGSHWHYGDVTNPADPLYANSAWNSSFGPSTISASATIYKVAQLWGLNPQVILATLQKESGLTSGTDCSGWRYNSAMGDHCPDTLTLHDYPYINILQTCVTREQSAGFSKQVLWASWQLKFNKERAMGNVVWDGDGDITYVGYMIQGTYKRCATCTANFYDGGAILDGQRIVLENATTAALYSYTPHLGQSFPGIFEGWFGSVLTACGTNEVPMAQVQRLYNPVTYENFYTAYQCEANAVISKLGFVATGSSFNTTSANLSGAAPVYRLYNPAGRTHLWTSSGDEITYVVTKLGFQIDGLAFYMAPPSASGAFPVYRLYNPKTYHHFWTLSQADVDIVTQRAGYHLEGTGFFSQ